MSFETYLSYFDEDWKLFIKKKCNIYEKATKWKQDPKRITIFNIRRDDENRKKILLPLSMWNDLCEDFPNEGPFEKINVKFEGEPLEEAQRDQKTVVAQTLKHLKEKHTCLLALRTGFGKTFLSLYLICQLKLKALVLCHATTLHEQWKEQAQKWCPKLKIQIVKGNNFDPSADVYMMGIIKATHFNENQFEGIGVVFVDEAHLALTNTFSDALLKIKPRYLVGLSATPDRNDGMHKLLYPYFGPKKEFIIREEVKDFTVIKYVTHFKPELKYRFDGTMDWTKVIQSIACNTSRQRFIVGLCKEYKKNKILILSDRVCEILGCKNYSKCACENQVSYGLYPLLKEEGESVDYRAENRKSHDEEVRVLVGTYGKLGVGYDSKRDLLILASDKTDIRQNEGRIRSKNNIVIDIVDSLKTFETHWKKREAWYKKRGATIIVKETRPPERIRLIGKNKF